MAGSKNTGGFGKGWKWALALSLALNLIFVGFLAGAAMRFGGEDMRDRRDGPRGQAGPMLSGEPFVRALPRDERRALARRLRDENFGLPSREERRALYARMIDLLRADPFDAEAVREVLQTQAKAAQDVQALAQAGWIEIIAGMSAAERAEVAEHLEERLDRRREKDKTRP